MPKPIRRIGASKLATVSECQTPQGTYVALKEYNRQPLSKFQHERIFTAAERWRTLNIPGLVPYFEVAAERHEVVMQLYDRSVASRLSEGPSDPRLVLHALRGILAPLAQLHERGWLHVNLKPTNVFFDGDGRARMSDGLLISAVAPVALPPPNNPKYLTPEHTSDAFGPMTPATDLYSVGFMALELLAGDRFDRAFQGIGDDAREEDLAWFQWHGSSQEAPHAQAYSKDCPASLSSVIAKLVAKRPSERYGSARQALDDLPQDITAQSRHPSPVAAPHAQREALSSHVIERPATGIVLAIASGSRAGEMIGTNDNELMIGFDHDCFLRFSSEQYPHGRGKVLLRRGTEGWYVLRVSGDSTFVNQHLLEEKSALRSGDIVRLSSRGPDVQFSMQSGGVALRALVDRFLPAQSQAAGRPALSPDSALRPAAEATPVRSAATAIPPRQPPLFTTTLGGFPWANFQTWNRRRTYTIIAMVGGVLALFAVFLSPDGASPTATEKPDKSQKVQPAAPVFEPTAIDSHQPQAGQAVASDASKTAATARDKIQTSEPTITRAETK